MGEKNNRLKIICQFTVACLSFQAIGRSCGAILILLGLWFLPTIGKANLTVERVLSAARQILDEAEVSYVYGGSKIGEPEDCDRCNICLEVKSPLPKERMSACPICAQCSLDCSHFTMLVMKNAGLYMPYLDTKTMLDLPPGLLRKHYRLIDLGRQIHLAAPGDFLVYKGHVVIVESKMGSSKGDVLHATGGRDVKLPGQGVQRERFVDFENFRGPLLRILRHQDLQRQQLKPLR